MGGILGTGIILLAAGEGKRFGGNKLLSDYKGRKLFMYAVDAAVQSGVEILIIVTGYEEVAGYCRERGFRVVMNYEPARGISRSIYLGMKELMSIKTDEAYERANVSEIETNIETPDMPESVIFGVCDQPEVKPYMYTKLVQMREKTQKGLIGTIYKGEEGNPCLFDRQYYKELMELEGDRGGRQVFRRHPEDTMMAEAESLLELMDIDYKDDDRIKRSSAETR